MRVAIAATTTTRMVNPATKLVMVLLLPHSSPCNWRLLFFFSFFPFLLLLLYYLHSSLLPPRCFDPTRGQTQVIVRDDYDIIQKALGKMQVQVLSGMDIGIESTARDTQHRHKQAQGRDQIPETSCMRGHEGSIGDSGGTLHDHVLHNHSTHGMSDQGDAAVVGGGVCCSGSGSGGADVVDDLPGVVRKLGDVVGGEGEGGRGALAYAAVVEGYGSEMGTDGNKERGDGVVHGGGNAEAGEEEDENGAVAEEVVIETDIVFIGGGGGGGRGRGRGR